MTLPIHKGFLALTLACAAYLFAANVPSAPAQNNAPPAAHNPSDLFRRAAEITNIRGQGSPPFHLKAHFVAMGPTEFSGEGDYEETWLAPDKWEGEVTFGMYHAVELRDGSKHRLTVSGEHEPKRVFLFIGHLTPGSYTVTATDKWKYSFDKTSGQSRILLRSKSKFDAPFSFTFNADGSVAQENGPLQIVSSDYSPFGERPVARSVDVSDLFGVLLKIKIAKLEALPANASLPEVSAPDAVATQTSKPFEAPSAATPGYMPPKLTYSVDPICPSAVAKQTGGGLALVTLIVDKNGNGVDLETSYASNPAFVPPSIAAIAQYRFDPAQLNGVPVDLPVNIEVRFKVY